MKIEFYLVIACLPVGRFLGYWCLLEILSRIPFDIRTDCDIQYQLMNMLDAVIYGVVEGITEFLPVSSTGHLILTARILGDAQTNFLKSFEISIQLGAILAVVVLYWKSLFVNLEIIKRLAAAFLPTAALGFVFYKLIKNFLGDSHIVLWSLLLGGIFLIVFEKFYKEGNSAQGEIAAMRLRDAFLIGVFQSVAMVPGVSRSAATIIGGLVLGLKRKTIVEFSFLLAVPTMLAATAFDLLKNASAFSGAQFQFLLVGFFVSFVTAVAAIKFLLHFIANHNFTIFGVYRVAVALIFFIFGLAY